MTPEEFAKRMREAADRDDIVERHIDMDALMVEALRSLGYGEGCALFEMASRSYA